MAQEGVDPKPLEVDRPVPPHRRANPRVEDWLEGARVQRQRNGTAEQEDRSTLIQTADGATETSKPCPSRRCVSQHGASRTIEAIDNIGVFFLALLFPQQGQGSERKGRRLDPGGSAKARTF